MESTPIKSDASNQPAALPVTRELGTPSARGIQSDCPSWRVFTGGRRISRDSISEDASGTTRPGLGSGELAASSRKEGPSLRSSFPPRPRRLLCARVWRAARLTAPPGIAPDLCASVSPAGERDIATAATVFTVIFTGNSPPRRNCRPTVFQGSPSPRSRKFFRRRNLRGDNCDYDSGLPDAGSLTR